MLFIFPSRAWTKQEFFAVCTVFWIRQHVYCDNLIEGGSNQEVQNSVWTLLIFGTVRVSILFLFFIAFLSSYCSNIESYASNLECVKIYFSMHKVFNLECNIAQFDYVSLFFLFVSLNFTWVNSGDRSTFQGSRDML